MRQARRVLMIAALLALGAQTRAGAALVNESFEQYPSGRTWAEGSSHGPWRVAFDGYGAVGVASDASKVLYLEPARAASLAETHAGLVLSRNSFGDTDVSTRMRTVRQLRAAPNPWEVAWLIWHHTDGSHFSYVALKPNGWEIGQTTPFGQRFLATGSAPRFATGAWHHVRVVQRGSSVHVWGDGLLLATVRDPAPYLSGSVGLYTEDARAHFDDVAIL